MNKLFVAGFPYETTDSQLEKLFSQIGKVLSVKIIMDRYTGQSKGFGFIEMDNADLAKLAINKLNNTDFNGRTLVVKEARPMESR